MNTTINEIDQEIIEKIKQDLSTKHGEITYFEILNIHKQGNEVTIRIEVRTGDSCYVYDYRIRNREIVHKELTYAIPMI